MDDTLFESLLARFERNDAAPYNDLESVEAHFGYPLPEDYKSFMLSGNGGEGFIGQEQYLVLWKAAELIDFNREYEVAEYAPGLILFGSNGAGEGFAFDTRGDRMNIVVIPFIGMELEYALPVADDFKSFIVQIAKPDGLFQ